MGLSVLVSVVLLADAGGSGCGSGLAAARAKIEKLPMQQRIAATLKVIGEGCGGLDATMAAAAKDAAGQKLRSERSRALARAQTDCAVLDATGAAEIIVQTCPPRSGDAQGRCSQISMSAPTSSCASCERSSPARVSSRRMQTCCSVG